MPGYATAQPIILISYATGNNKYKYTTLENSVIWGSDFLKYFFHLILLRVQATKFITTVHQYCSFDTDNYYQQTVVKVVLLPSNTTELQTLSSSNKKPERYAPEKMIRI